MPDRLTNREWLIVRLIDAGYRRQRVAELAGISDDAAREIIRGMCERYGVRMDLLPDAVGYRRGSEHPTTTL
jgi:hypothetical protein